MDQIFIPLEAKKMNHPVKRQKSLKFGQKKTTGKEENSTESR